MKQRTSDIKTNIICYLFYEEHWKTSDISELTYETFNKLFPAYSVECSGYICKGVNPNTHISSRQVENICNKYKYTEDITVLDVIEIGYTPTGKSTEEDFKLAVSEPDLSKFMELCGYKIKYGFNRNKTRKASGFNSETSGYFYIWHLTNTVEDFEFIKFGITNKDVNTRHKQQLQAANRNNYNYDSELIFSTGLISGDQCSQLEKDVIKLCKYNNYKNIHRHYFPDGYTETCGVDLLPLILDLVA